MTLDEAKAAPEGTAVIYAPQGGQPEQGWITGTSDTMVFVRYGSDSHSKATRPEDLAFAFVNDAMLARKLAGSGRRGASYSNGPLEPRSLRDLPRTETIFNLMEPRPYQ